MVVFARSIGGYQVLVDNTIIGFYTDNGVVYRYTVEEWYMGIMSREDAYRLFSALYIGG
jgi:hypothetical protein